MYISRSTKECYVQNDFSGTLLCQECLFSRLGPPLHADPEVSVEDEVRFWVGSTKQGHKSQKVGEPPNMHFIS